MEVARIKADASSVDFGIERYFMDKEVERLNDHTAPLCLAFLVAP